MAAARWTTIEEFLTDLPRYHCTTKPKHLFCTVCMRINHAVAYDCPLREVPDSPAPRAQPVRRAPEVVQVGPAFDPATPEDVPAAVLAEGPVIEFAPASEPPAKKRMKAKPLGSRSPGGTPPHAPAPGAPPALSQAAGEADFAQELKGWDPEASTAAPKPEAPEPSPQPVDESDSKRGRRRKR